MNTILTINFTGSVCLVVYLLTKHFLGDRLTRQNLYWLLRANVICFLVPFNLLGEIYHTLWLDIRLLTGWRSEDPLRIAPGDALLLQSEEGVRLSIGLKGRLMLISGYLLLIILLFLVGVIWDYTKKRPVHRAIRESGISTDTYLLTLQKEYGIRRKVEVCYCRDASQIATIGMFHPIIFFKDPGNEPDKKLLLCHELCHIKRYDVLWKWMARLACCIHCYNPMVYLLHREMERMREQSCDEWVVSEQGLDGRERYSRLLINSSVGETDMYHSVAFFAENDSYDKMSERINLIMKDNRKKKFGRRAVTILMAAVLWTVSLTAFAYDDVHWWSEDTGMECSSGDCQGCGAEEYVAYVLPNDFTEKLEVENGDIPVLYDCQYVDEDGNVFSMEGGEITPKVICIFHSYQDVTIVEHYLLTDGSCQMKYYDAQRCEKCGKVKSKTLIKTVTYATCPHN